MGRPFCLCAFGPSFAIGDVEAGAEDHSGPDPRVAVGHFAEQPSRQKCGPDEFQKVKRQHRGGVRLLERLA